MMYGITNNKTTEAKPIEVERNLFLEIQQLKQQLAETDYVACKIAEGSATAEDYAEIITQRQKWREEINAYESELKKREL